MTQNNAVFYNAVLHALSDKQVMSIIDCTRDTAKSMNQIMKETNMSRTTTHRKIQSMLKDQILVVENFIITPDGKKCKLFRSRISHIAVKYEGNDMYVIVEDNPHAISKIQFKVKKGRDPHEHLRKNHKENIESNYLVSK
jgi:hypothetical protein